MKEFMFFIRKRSNSENTLSPEKLNQFLKACETYIDKLKQQGKLISAKPIVWSGKILSAKTGNWEETPYNETKEIIGGYYHILARDIDEAIEIAKANPEFTFNEDTRIEVRPVKMKEEKTGYTYPSE
jgi:hypothetical protein